MAELVLFDELPRPDNAQLLLCAQVGVEWNHSTNRVSPEYKEARRRGQSPNLRLPPLAHLHTPECRRHRDNPA
jgi:hypothetical protein